MKKKLADTGLHGLQLLECMVLGCNSTEISVVLTLGIIRIDEEKKARNGPFFAENQFSLANEAMFMGLVV